LRIIINAGHTKLEGGTGAVGFVSESIETRKISYEVLKQLADTDHEVIPAIFDKSSNNLKQAVTLSNENIADLFLSIHLNAGGGHGSEIYTWKGNQTNRARKVLNNLASLGFKDRGIKDGSKLYVIKNTKCEAMLIEVYFLDNKSDIDLFNKNGYEAIAKAIVNGIK